VNEIWSGLGYYRRAKFLHEGAKTVVEKFGGKLPTTSQELEKIPGIGKYTAGFDIILLGNLIHPRCHLFDCIWTTLSPCRYHLNSSSKIFSH
jgi:endonuclease III